MSNKNGLLAPQATHGNPEISYYARADAPVIVEPLFIEAKDKTTTAALYVDGAASGAYQGAINIVPGGNGVSAIPAAGITIRTGAAQSTIAEVGTNTIANNLLLIAGTSGTGQVYDEVYNQPVALQPITLSATNPLCAPTVGNVGEIFRCSQAGVAASAVSAIGTNFQVPKTGWYALQMEVKLGNAPAPAPTTINVPITVSAGVNLGELLSFAIAQGVVNEPYGLMEVSSNEMCVSEVLTQNSIVVRNYASLHLFTAGTTYTFSLRATSALWNIGDAGQIKAELIAMC